AMTEIHRTETGVVERVGDLAVLQRSLVQGVRRVSPPAGVASEPGRERLELLVVEVCEEGGVLLRQRPQRALPDRLLQGRRPCRRLGQAEELADTPQELLRTK